MRLFGLLLAIALTIGASQAIKHPGEAVDPHQALCRDSSNPYRWSDLAASYQSHGDLTHASACYQRALVLSGQAAQIGLEVANFHFDHGEYDQAMPLAVRVLKSVSTYDDVLFSHFDQILPSDPATIFMSVGTHRRSVRAYTQHLIDCNDIGHARLAWRFAQSSHFTDDRLTSAYLEALLRAHHYADAQHDWAEYLGDSRSDYPDRNWLFNSGFEREPTGSPLDWRIQPSDQFETVRDDSVTHSGKWSLKIRFHGLDNTQYSNISQTTYLPPGRYTFSGWVRSENIATSQGVQIEIADALDSRRFVIRTSSITGTSDWHLLSQSFQVPSTTQLLAIRVVRWPSGEFGGGSVWLDDLRLARYSSPYSPKIRFTSAP